MATQTDYKLLQEQFVSNFNGTSKLEIGIAASVTPLSVLFRDVLTAWLFANKSIPKKWKFCVEFVTLILPIQLCLTVLSLHVYNVLMLMFLVIVGVFMVNHHLDELMTSEKNKSNPERTKRAISVSEIENRHMFVSSFRAYVLIVTAISILAVDFTIFPRRFCKAELFGQGGMDAGVGAFIISNAVVSPEARGKCKTFKNISDKFQNLAKVLLSCLPLLILGTARTLAVKGSNYQEHVSEYGVHWNFFFTLAAVKILSTVILSFTPVNLCSFLGIVISIVYEYALQQFGLKDYIVLGIDGKGGRAGIIDANREGLYSVFGYLAVYLIGIQIGHFVFSKKKKVPTATLR